MFLEKGAIIRDRSLLEMHSCNCYYLFIKFFVLKIRKHMQYNVRNALVTLIF